MVKITIEDIVFWILILFIVSIVLWMLHGSPTEEGAIISIGITIISSELMLWKKFYNFDKKVSVSFIKIRSDIEKNNIIIHNKLDSIENKFNNKFNDINNKLNLIIKRR
jgi:hypothetical protein